jgi:superfamily II DNA or RNA helicase
MEQASENPDHGGLCATAQAAEGVELWNHQAAAIEQVILSAASGVVSGLIVLPTGAGKTATSLTLARTLAVPTLFLVHRTKLMNQAIVAAARYWPEASVGVIAGERDEWAGGTLLDPRPPDWVVGMVPTLRQSRLERIPRDRFGLIICDECHHAPSAQWQTVLDYFQPGFLLGVTATPERADGAGLEKVFGRKPLFTYALPQAIADGVLCPIESMAIRTQVDLDTATNASGTEIMVPTASDDFPLQTLAAAVDTAERNAMVVDAHRKHGGDRRAIAFAVDVAHARHLTEAFTAAGVRATYVAGEMGADAVEEVLDQFSQGQWQVVCSCDLLTEGFDDPGVSLLLMARPTKSRSLYMQMVGRGLRRAPGKTNCLVIDFTDNSRNHKLVCSLDLRGRNREASEAEPAERTEEPAANRPAVIVPVVSWELETICPWPELPSLVGYRPLQPWHHDPASPGQIKYLRALGLGDFPGMTKGQAAHLIDQAEQYEASFPTPPTERQRGYLQTHDLWRDGMSRRQASQLIGWHKGSQRSPRPVQTSAPSRGQNQKTAFVPQSPKPSKPKLADLYADF